MRQADGGVAPNYNVQISADAAQSLIVDVKVTQAPNDSEQLAPAVGRIAPRLGHKPRQMLADGDYTNRRSIEAMAALEVDCVGSLRKGGAEKDNTGRGRFTTAVFVYDPEQDPAHVRETSLCATKDDTRTSRATSSTAMKPALRTARTAR
jgi:hypothetical protein